MGQDDGDGMDGPIHQPTSDPHEELTLTELLGPSPLNQIGNMQWAAGILVTSMMSSLGVVDPRLMQELTNPRAVTVVLASPFGRDSG